MHDLSLVVTLAGALAVALLGGWITERLGLSTLVGYLIAGIVVGPHTPGFVADAALASQMAEIGVILLLFGVGMHFDAADLWRVSRVAIPGAIVQSAVATVAGWLVARAFGWSDVAGLVFGMALAVASTAVLTRMLIDHRLLSTHGGHVAVGWLIVEDLFTVVALVILPALATAGAASALPATLGVAFVKATAFVLLLFVLGGRLVTRIIERVARTGSEELLTLAVFVAALGIAALAAGLFDVSVALGAFFAGVVMGRSRLGPQAGAVMAPFRDVFAALFFVSVGMLFDPVFALREPVKVLAATAIVLIAKPLAAVLIVRGLGDTAATASTVSIGLAQIGEFSFLLGALALSLRILPQEALDTLVAAAILSIALNPLLFRWLARRKRAPGPDDAAVAEGSRDRHDHVVLCGEGALHRALVGRLRKTATAISVVDADLDFVDSLTQEGVDAVFGDPSRTEVLRAAGLDRAAAIVVTTPSLPARMAIALAVRQANGRAALIVTAADPAERAWLAEFGVGEACDVTTPVVQAIERALARALDR
jgi:CPA2 family monovalent cation:H+ antiporter-2